MMPLRHPTLLLPTTAPMSRDVLTDVELLKVDIRLEHRLRFGRIAAECVASNKARIVSFRPQAVFAVTRWTSNDFGTAHSRIDILRAVGAEEAYTTVPFVRPGGELFLSITGWPKVRQVLAAIDAVEAAGVDPCDAAPDHWRHVQARVSAGEPYRPYTAQRHAAWLKRKAIEL